jgi:hypothetical protein
LRSGGQVQRGYNIEALQAVFTRYCGENIGVVPDLLFQGATALQSKLSNDLEQNQSARGRCSTAKSC